MQNAFYFTLKAFFLLRYLISLLAFLIAWENGLIRKLRFISKFMTSGAGNQTITIHKLPNFSSSEGDQTIRFDQFIEYNLCFS